MTVYEIKLPERNEYVKLAEMLLAKNIFNDHLFERLFLTVTLKVDSHEDFLYRKLWESVYIRNGWSKIIKKTEGICDVMISLSEAMNFIKQATPPVLRYMIDDIKSFDDVKDVMFELLGRDNGGQQGLYLSMFKKLMYLQEFQTNASYDEKRLKVLRSFNPKGLLADVEACTFDIIHNQKQQEDLQCLQVTFNTNTIADTKLLVNNMFEPHSEFELTNVFRNKYGLCATFYSTDYIWDGFVNQIIQSTYQNIIKK